MDPIHPIIPVAPNITPVTPTPLIGGVDRDARRHGTDADKRRRRRPTNAPADQLDYPSGERHGEADSGLHIDVTA
jgi:hypothetical protein